MGPRPKTSRRSPWPYSHPYSQATYTTVVGVLDELHEPEAKNANRAIDLPRTGSGVDLVDLFATRTDLGKEDPLEASDPSNDENRQDPG